MPPHDLLRYHAADILKNVLNRAIALIRSPLCPNANDAISAEFSTDALFCPIRVNPDILGKVKILLG